MTVNAGTSTFKGTVKMTEGNAASSTTTGALQITGGLSASNNSYFDAQVIIKKAVMEYDNTDECLYFSFKS